MSGWSFWKIYRGGVGQDRGSELELAGFTWEGVYLMRDKRNAVLVVILFVVFCWAFWAWLMHRNVTGEAIWVHRLISMLFLFTTAGVLFWSMKFEDRLPDHLAEYTGGVYYEQSGLCFMPVMRKEGDRAYLCLYYQNRYDSPVEAIVHLRPPAETIQHRPDARDIRFAFICPGGGVGLIQQPVAVHPKLQGQTVNVKMAASVNYRHNRGQQVRSNRGMPCGSIEVDWGINFRTGMHELSGEIALDDPVVIHLPIPRDVSNRIKAGEQWKQEILFVPEK